MTPVFIAAGLILALFLIKRARSRGIIRGLAEKPYRYPLDVRRSPWANRKGF